MQWLMDYAPGWDVFERQKGSFISGVIEDIEEMGSPDLKSFFVPSHVFKIINETTGIEASTEGVAYFPLSKYFNDPTCELLMCRPAGLDDATVGQMLAVSEKLVKKKLGYDYLGLAGDTLEAILHLDELIPELEKVADPFHGEHELFCSALVSVLNKACPKYAGEWLFRQYTVSKISPLMLLAEFPYDRMKGWKGLKPKEE